ncbi:hypothetical protein QO206_13365 [Leeuwenhoekiella aequorea]|uniref:hypothetical protein n=1 Tax=Leeuwenhoekiella aequorea TaxID=283736 RepID=UPI00352F0C58|tara:strand:+ start:34803 stop:35159 length:357 start_codon:yes stop_codon:yes gene_type:complete
MSNELLIALFGGGSIAAIISSFKLPEIIKGWKDARQVKYDSLQKQLELEQEKIRGLELQLSVKSKELETEKMKMTEMKIWLSATIPMMRIRNSNDPETLELIKMIEDNIKFEVTSSRT